VFISELLYFIIDSVVEKHVLGDIMLSLVRYCWTLQRIAGGKLAMKFRVAQCRAVLEYLRK